MEAGRYITGRSAPPLLSSVMEGIVIIGLLTSCWLVVVMGGDLYDTVRELFIRGARAERARWELWVCMVVELGGVLVLSAMIWEVVDRSIRYGYLI